MLRTHASRLMFHSIKRIFFPLFIISFFISSCSVPATQQVYSVSIQVDGAQKKLEMTGNKTVLDVINQAGIQTGALDRVEPSLDTTISKSTAIVIKRVREEFKVEEKEIPFPQQTLKNESMPEKQVVVIQKGINGKQQITIRTLIEDNVEISNNVTKTVTISEATPEIIMVGVQSPFSPVTISGKLIFISGNNAWKMEGATSNRTPVTNSGDLDGRILSVSPKGDFLLFTRKTSDDETEGHINSLWIVDLTEDDMAPKPLGINNVIHFADWYPQKGMMIAYSTVEPRTAAPGWQANNDLHILSISPNGQPLKDTELIKPGSGGVYGWWGTNFCFSPDGQKMAYSRPDGIGTVDLKSGRMTPLLSGIPFQTRADWAWVAGIDWASNSSLLYSVIHQSKSGFSDETSPVFDLVTYLPGLNQAGLVLTSQAGMFAYPSLSPEQPDGRSYLAYLQAIFPEQSETSRYRLFLMDQDGSNRVNLFPADGSAGLDPQQLVWSPVVPELNISWIGLIYQNNLWLINPSTKQPQQVTGDGTITRLDWNIK